MRKFFFKVMVLQDFFRMGGTEQQTLKFYKTLSCFNKNVAIGLFFKGGFLEGNLKSYGTVTNTIGVDLFKAKFVLNFVEKTKPTLIICMGKLANLYSFFLYRSFCNIKVVQTIRTGKKLSFLKKVGSYKSYLLANSINSKCRYLREERQGFKCNTLSNLPAYYIKPLSIKYKVKFRRKFKVRGADYAVLCIATFRGKKGHYSILKVVRSLICSGLRRNPKVKLFLVGGGLTFKNCNSYTKTHGFQRNIFFIRNSQNTSLFYSITDVSVLASEQESLPNFLMESMRSKKPVVCYSTSGSKECVFSNKVGLVVRKCNVRMFFNYLNLTSFHSNFNKVFSSNIQTLYRSNSNGLLKFKLNSLLNV